MLKQTQSFKLSQRLSPQQIQLMKLIQLSNTALEERIKEELQDNAALDDSPQEREEDEDWDEQKTEEEKEKDDILEDLLTEEFDDTPDYKLKSNNYSSDDEEKEIPFASGQSFVQLLNSQIGMCSLGEKKEAIAYYLVGSLESDGYLRRSIIDITDDLAFRQGISTTEEEVEEVLYIIQDFDPPGVGARDLKECLTIQLEKKPATPARVIALNILDHYFNEFSKRHFEKLLLKLEISNSDLKLAAEEIRHLNPKPGNASHNNNKPTETIIPDFFVTINEGEIELALNSKDIPELHISRSFRDTINHYKKTKEKKSKKARNELTFIKSKIDSAKWFIEAIKQRQQTLRYTMTAIIEFQKEYFLTGDQKELKPMILKDIAEEIGMDISTISRVASNKHVQTPYGTFLIKTLFSESMKNSDGEDVSTKEIKKNLEELIEIEDKIKPLTDEALVRQLKERGFPIARRTVAKYREQLDIPVARMRKQI